MPHATVMIKWIVCPDEEPLQQDRIVPEGGQDEDSFSQQDNPIKMEIMLVC